MSARLLSLQFAQLTSAWEKSEFNEYSDSQKQSYQSKLKELFRKINDENFINLTPNEVTERKVILDFFFKSLEFLDSSTLNLIPFELVKCLESALRDWSETFNNYIIVTSLVNNIGMFSFDPTLATNEPIYDLIKQVYKIEFDYRLIQINLPRYLSRDYLANVVLYHELGHFVDTKYVISSSLKDEILKNYTGVTLLPHERSNLEKYFPFLLIPNMTAAITNGYQILQMHIWEYFCDLFASQYISESLNHYLGYITQMNSNYQLSHPSTVNRIEMVESFLAGKTDNYTLGIIKTATKLITNKDLQIRFTPFSDSDIINFLPAEISTDLQLHYLFSIGWDLWLNKKDEIKKQNKITYEMGDQKIYQIINNLIEKSIGNYIIKTSWGKAKNVSK